MALTVFRTTYSGVLKDNMDYSTGFADADGKLVAQGLTLPGHLGSVPTAMAAIMRHFGDDMSPGDVFIMNDPFDGGMHLPDIFVFKPLYHEGKRLAFACTVCHHTDVGGRVAGSNASDSTEIYAEGLRIAPLKLYEAGKLNDTIMTFIEKNVRLPVKVFGDLRAQLAACHIAEQQFAELVAKHGPEQTAAFMRETVDYAERLTRASLAKLPDGEWSFEDWIDDDGVDYGKPIRLFVTIRKTGGHMVVDWTGTSPQVKGAINNTLSFTKAASYTRRALGAAARHSQQRGRVPRHRGDLPARHGRQRRAAGRLRRARPHRLPHGRLHVRRAGDDAARQGQGGGRRRQHRHLDRRLRRRAQALHLCRLHLRRLGRAAVGRRARRQLAHVRQHGLAFDRGDRGRGADPAAGLRVRGRQGGRRQISRRRAVPARLPLPRGRRASCRSAPTAATTGRSASTAAAPARRRRTISIRRPRTASCPASSP